MTAPGRRLGEVPVEQGADAAKQRPGPLGDLEPPPGPPHQAVADQAGKRFPHHPRPSEMFNEVNLREAAERQQESIRQGVAALEQFVAEGKRSEAELALKLLKGKVDEARFGELEERVRAL